MIWFDAGLLCNIESIVYILDVITRIQQREEYIKLTESTIYVWKKHHRSRSIQGNREINLRSGVPCRFECLFSAIQSPQSSSRRSVRPVADLMAATSSSTAFGC